MVSRSCDICYVEFEARNSRKRCGDECEKEGRRRYALAWYHSNTETVAKRNKKYRDATPARQLLKGALWRSSKRGEICTLTEADIFIPEICPILGIPLTASGRYGPTLDRKDSGKGYILGNIWVISKIANMMKSDSTPEEQRKFAAWVKTQEQYQKISTRSLKTEPQ